MRLVLLLLLVAGCTHGSSDRSVYIPPPIYTSEAILLPTKEGDHVNKLQADLKNCRPECKQVFKRNYDENTVTIYEQSFPYLGVAAYTAVCVKDKRVVLVERFARKA